MFPYTGNRVFEVEILFTHIFKKGLFSLLSVTKRIMQAMILVLHNFHWVTRDRHPYTVPSLAGCLIREKEDLACAQNLARLGPQLTSCLTRHEGNDICSARLNI